MSSKHYPKYQPSGKKGGHSCSEVDSNDNLFA